VCFRDPWPWIKHSLCSFLFLSKLHIKYFQLFLTFRVINLLMTNYYFRFLISKTMASYLQKFKFKNIVVVQYTICHTFFFHLCHPYLKKTSLILYILSKVSIKLNLYLFFFRSKSFFILTLKEINRISNNSNSGVQ